MVVVEQAGIELIVEGIQQVLKQLQTVDKSINGLATTSSHASNIMDGTIATALGNILVKAAESAINAIVSLGRAVINLGKEGLQAYADYERLGASLQSLAARELVNTGRADNLTDAMGMAGEQAQELLGWIQQLAIESPFTQAGVADAFRTAMAYGFTTDEAKRLTGAMIDFAAGSGATEGSMNQIALALGQIQAKGKLSGQEVLQLVNAGLAVDQILAKAFGKSTAEIVEMREKGLIPADDAINAIVESLETDFGGAAKRQANTFSGLISTMSDIKEVGLREFFTGTFQAIQPYLTTFVDTLSSPEFMASIRDIGMSIGEWVATFIANLPTVIEQVKGVIDFIGGLKTGVSEVMPFVLQFANVFISAWDTIAAALATIVPVVINWFTTMQPQFQAWGEFVMQVINQVVAFVVPLFQEMVAFLAEKIGFIVSFVQANLPLFQAYFEVALTTIKGIWDSVWSAIVMIVSSVWEVIKTIINVALEIITGIIQGVMQAVTGDWEGVWNTIKETAASVWEAIKQGVSDFINNVLEKMGTTMGEVKTTWENNWNMLVSIVETIWSKIKTSVSEAIATVKGFFKNADWGEIGKSIITGIANGISSAAGAIADAAKNAAQAALDAAKRLLGIDSPSSVFRDEIGKNIDYGIAAGIGDFTPVISGQMKGLTDALLPALGNMTRTVAGLAPASAAGNSNAYYNNSNSSNVTNNMIHLTPALALETVGMTVA